MQDKPSLHSNKTQVFSNTVSSAKKPSFTQHETRIPNVAGKKPSDNGQSFLLSIPSESLTHITTFIGDPHALLALSRVNRQLRSHVVDDNTWYRAFAFHFWGLGPEEEPSHEMVVMLRKLETTWKKEFLRRHEVLRRWEKSRSSVLSYTPQYCNISNMHLLDNMSLLTSSIQYGIVGRSFPLTGKLLKGYFDAAGTANGQGIGNPNAEFSPHVTCIALSSSGGTGRIAWGFRNGQVATTSAPKIMESNRSAAKFVRSHVENEHRGDVRCIQFAGWSDEFILSGCSHGLVKLWETKRMRCLWSGSTAEEDTVLSDACVKLQYSHSSNVVVSAFQSGDLVIWWGFEFQEDGTGGRSILTTPSTIRIPQPAVTESSLGALYIDPNSSSDKVILLLHYEADAHFVQLIVDLPTGDIALALFSDGPIGHLTSFKPSFVTKPVQSPLASAPITPVITGTSSLSIGRATDSVFLGPSSFILAGDSLGQIFVWSWDTEGGLQPARAGATDFSTLSKVRSMHKWEAHDDGSVSAIESNDVVIITGSAQGTLKVWDALTFAPLRTFSSPAPRSAPGQTDAVNHIILRNDLLVVGIGSRILVWQARPITSEKKNKGKHVRKPKGRGSSSMSKWQQQVELNNDIRESKRLLEDERKHTQLVNDRARAQQLALSQLGLTEAEAVEYLMMLSREDEQHTLSELSMVPITSESVSGATDQKEHGIVDHDDAEGIFTFDDSNEYRLSESPSSRHHYGTPSSSRLLAQTLPNFKEEVQSPHSLPSNRDLSSGLVPISAAPVSSHPINVAVSSTPASSFDHEVFPSMSSSWASRSVSSVRLTGSWSRGSPSIVGSTPSPPASSNSNPSPNASSSSRASFDSMIDVEDEELKYALQLSLAEARSRGEDV